MKSKESVFDFTNNELKLDVNDIEEFFKIIEGNSKKSQIENSHDDTSEKSENMLMSSLIDSNKFTAICNIILILIDIAIRNLNFNVKFNSLVENFHLLFIESDEDTNDLITDILLKQDIINSLHSILPTENEIKQIISNMTKLKLDQSDSEKWILKVRLYIFI